ncbi:DUF2920 family protein [Campylobacter coli]|uniref:DUF2920 family protein n=1 Tax=Campylobacter coli TaxID=195 RepID=UPI000A713FEA
MSYFLETKEAAQAFNVSTGALRLAASRNSNKYEWLKVDNEKGGRGGKKLLFKISKDKLLTAFNQELISKNTLIYDEKMQKVKLSEIITTDNLKTINNSLKTSNLNLAEPKMNNDLAVLNLKFENLSDELKEDAKSKVKLLKQVEKYIEGGLSIARTLKIEKINRRFYERIRKAYKENGILGLIDTRGLHRKDKTKLSAFLKYPLQIAPWSIDFILDNSSFVNLFGNIFRLIGFGKEIDFTRYHGTYDDTLFKNIFLYLSDKTYWNNNKFSKKYFSNARKIIREPLNKEHLIIQSLYPNPKYILYHSIFDERSPFENKENFVHILKELNFKVEFFAVSQVDNKFIKNLNHGMGLSTKLFFKKHLLQILKEPLQDKICKKEVSYKCDELVYTFKEENHQIILNITN